VHRGEATKARMASILSIFADSAINHFGLQVFPLHLQFAVLVALGGFSQSSVSRTERGKLVMDMGGCNLMIFARLSAVFALGAMVMLIQSAQAATTEIHYRTVDVAGIEIFYREAGNPKAPTILLLHGFPTSSHMFRDLIPLLADRYHLIAPDYPGFGYSARPNVTEFNYTFDHLADVMEGFVDSLGLKRYALYMQDFGGPV
jgi:hypothetical protein